MEVQCIKEAMDSVSKEKLLAHTKSFNILKLCTSVMSYAFSLFVFQCLSKSSV